MEREYSVVYRTIEDDWVLASVPELPGAVTQGRTIAEAREMIQDLVPLLLQTYREKANREAGDGAVWETLRFSVAAA